MNKSRLSPKNKAWRTWLLLLTFLCGYTVLHASSAHSMQERTISGTVVDETNIPLTGVSVSVAGSTIGTITDIDGNYSIKVLNEQAVLNFSFIGYTNQSIQVNKQSLINVVLQEDTKVLDEVVVVGYGVQKKSHLTGAITKVKTDGLEDIPLTRIDQALQGRVAGVNIQNTTSEVGEAPTVRVRGLGSISTSSDPLIIIDGFPVPDGLGTVDANDIQSIEVLKDAASAAIYGSRAANGVIMITTKSGQAEKPTYTLKMYWGSKQAYKLHPIMSSREYVQMVTQEEILKGSSQLPNAEFAFSCIDNNTDWQDEGLRTANIYNLSFGVSGGKKDIKYYISGSYADDQGIMITNEFKKMNVRAKIDAKLSDKVNIGINMNPGHSKKNQPATNFIDFYRTPSWMPVTHTEATSALTGKPIGSYVHGAQFNNLTYTGIDPISGVERSVKVSPFNTANHNPRMIMDNQFISQEEYRMQASAYLDINIWDKLYFKTSNGFNISYRETNNYMNREAKKDGEPNRGLYQNRLYTDLLSENTFTYHNKIDKKHDIDALLGFSVQETATKTAGILGKEFPTDMVQTLNAATMIEQYEANSAGEAIQYTGTWAPPAVRLVSFFGRISYAYDDKYLLSASLRDDGCSKFGKDVLWAWFPSVSAGWRISEEEWLKGNTSWLDQLKLRLSYGVTGNNQLDDYANTNLVKQNNYITGTGNGVVTPGMGIGSSVLGNSGITWEQTNEYNTGVDISILNNRISLALDYYYSTTKKLLFLEPLNSASGYTEGWTNNGKVRNKGVEIELTTQNVKNKMLDWTSSFNFSLNKNKVLDLAGQESIITKGERNEMYIAKVGEPAVQFYGFKTEGIWKSTEEINNNPHHINDVEGGLRVANTNNDNVINDQDMVPLGTPFPDFTWGVINNLKYKSFDLSFLFQGVQGISVLNGDGFYNETMRWNENYVSNRWISPEHPGDGKTPYRKVGIDQMMTDYFVEDASYISLRDVTLGYTLPKKVSKKVSMKKLRAYASIQNLGYWWTGDYRGINPEARVTSGTYNQPLISGYQRGAFPLQRTFSIGVDITF